MTSQSVGFVGAVGGAGTTQSVIEIGGALARDGRAVLVLDLDFATQGLERHVEGSIPVDSTALLSDPDRALADAVQEWSVDGSGSLGVVPARAPFVQVADAKSAEAGERVADRIAEAAADWVLLDVPPVVSNQAVGAVTAADRTIGVIPPTDRGVDALQRERGRLADVGTSFDGVLAVGAGDPPPDATAKLPARPDSAPAHRPATLESGGSFARAVASAAEQLLEVEVEPPNSPSATDRLGSLGDRFR